MSDGSPFVPVFLKNEAEDFAGRLFSLDDDGLRDIGDLLVDSAYRPDERMGCACTIAEIVYHHPRDSEALCLHCMGLVMHTVHRHLDEGEFFCECRRCEPQEGERE